MLTPYPFAASAAPVTLLLMAGVLGDTRQEAIGTKETAWP